MSTISSRNVARLRTHAASMPPPAMDARNDDLRTPAAASRPPVASGNSLKRACRRVLGWVAPRRVAEYYAHALGAPVAPATPSGRIPACGTRRARLWLKDRTLSLDIWGDPHGQPFVLFAMSTDVTHVSSLVPWVHALTAAGYAVVHFGRVSSPGASRQAATLPEIASDLAAVGHHFGRAGAVIGHSIGATATVLALAGGFAADRIVLLSAQADPREVVNRFARRIGVDEPVIRHLATLLERRMGMSLNDLQAHRIAPAIATPALVVHDLLDDEVPWSEGERFARHLPSSRLLTTLELGHHGVLDDARVLRDCMRFLAGGIVGDRMVSSPNLPYGIA